ncbi:MAG: hypothetical protein JXB24_11895 [Bacteroidales bacterium]|nr:hypothetical protein [Bacteroidales bacterium]
MKKNSFNTIKHILILVCIILSSSISCNLHMDVPEQHALQSDTLVEDDSFLIGESIAYKNLEIFPIVRNGKTEGQKYRILSEVIKGQDVVLEETGNVNLLSISNNTKDYIFILAGDIVKGGRQDRTMENDIIIPPYTKKVPLESYCVESGRWQKRGQEEVNEFSDNTKVLSSRDLKLASRYSKDQSAVWQKVTEKQYKLNKNLAEMKGENVDVRSPQSGTSLQLTLENKELEDVTKEFKSNLNNLNDFSENSIGFAYAINGQFYGMDIYHSRELFVKLQAKLFDAVIAEAISEYEKDISFVPVNREDLYELMKHMLSANVKETKINEHTMERMFEGDQGVMFETVDITQEKQWVRKNYIFKEDYKSATEQRNQEIIQIR